MKKNVKIMFTILTISIICIIAVNYYYQNNESNEIGGNKTITDMIGRTVEIPAKMDKIIATSPPMTTVVYMLAPEKISGLNYNWTETELQYVSDEYKNIPIIGGWFGRQDGNYEEMISAGPDIVIEGAMGEVDIATINERQEKFGLIPVVGVNDSTDVTKMASMITFFGNLLGGNAKDKAEKLVNFNDENLNKVKSVVETIPENQKKRVYYAEGSEGLQTDPSGSVHSQLIDLCGGINVANITVQEGVGQVDVSMEQVIEWDPEVIITVDPTFYANVYDNPNWENIKAVKNKEVYLSPQSPFKWFDRPPGANIIIGVPWTAKVIYPDKFTDLDLVSMTKDFYSEFYHFDLSDQEVVNLLKESGLKEENF